MKAKTRKPKRLQPVIARDGSSYMRPSSKRGGKAKRMKVLTHKFIKGVKKATGSKPTQQDITLFQNQVRAQELLNAPKKLDPRPPTRSEEVIEREISTAETETILAADHNEEYSPSRPGLLIPPTPLVNRHEREFRESIEGLQRMEINKEREALEIEKRNFKEMKEREERIKKKNEKERVERKIKENQEKEKTRQAENERERKNEKEKKEREEREHKQLLKRKKEKKEADRKDRKQMKRIEELQRKIRKLELKEEKEKRKRKEREDREKKRKEEGLKKTEKERKKRLHQVAINALEKKRKRMDQEEDEILNLEIEFEEMLELEEHTPKETYKIPKIMVT